MLGLKVCSIKFAHCWEVLSHCRIYWKKSLQKWQRGSIYGYKWILFWCVQNLFSTQLHFKPYVLNNYVLSSRVDTYHITQLHKFPPYKFLHFEDFEELFFTKKLIFMHRKTISAKSSWINHKSVFKISLTQNSMYPCFYYILLEIVENKRTKCQGQKKWCPHFFSLRIVLLHREASGQSHYRRSVLCTLML